MNDKRTGVRQECFLRAEALLAGGAEKLLCEARDISDSGLKLVGQNLESLPDKFILSIPRRGINEGVTVKRRSPTEVGVQFDAFQP